MVEDEDEILARAHGDVGAAGGGFGGSLGASWTARRPRTMSHETELTLHVPLSTAVENDQAALTTMSHRLLRDQPAIFDDQQRIRRVVGGGYLNLNPVLITMSLTAQRADATALKIRAAAKEGLIKQRSAEKSVTKLVGLIDADIST